MSDVDVGQITGTAKSVQQLLANNKYALDYYQREYGWEENQVGELIDDLTSRFDDEYEETHERTDVASYRPYFLGPIVTATRSGRKFIVDGQQRLTTLTLLLMHIRALLESMPDEIGVIDPMIFSSSYGQKSFNLDVDEREKCMSVILEGGDFEDETASESVRNLWRRYQNIVDRFPEELANGDALPYFKDWLLNRVLLVEITAVDQDMALEIFETMNDRGLRLSNTDMLKSFLLSRTGDSETIKRLNELWRNRVTELSDVEKNADAEFIKAWLRGNYAETQRERRKAATPGDFDVIGTAFHKWVRDNTSKIGLERKDDHRLLVEHEFMRLSGRYIELLEATQTQIPGLEPVFYNATTGFTLQLPVILAALTPDDDDEAFRAKSRVVAGALDIFVARRMVNFRNFGYSTVQYSMFNLMKRVRNRPVGEVIQELGEWLASEPERLRSISRFRLTQRNRSHIRYLLARMTGWLDEQTGKPDTFAEYVDRERKHPYEVEHIWANHYDRYQEHFPSEHDFQDHRNLMGGLVLLPKDFNASFGDLPYGEKVHHYNAQNSLVRSLHPMAYENNPSFLKLVSDAGLPFTAYPNEFEPEAIDQRQGLYRQICELVWDPAAIGIDEPTNMNDLRSSDPT